MSSWRLARGTATTLKLLSSSAVLFFNTSLACGQSESDSMSVILVTVIILVGEAKRYYVICCKMVFNLQLYKSTTTRGYLIKRFCFSVTESR